MYISLNKSINSACAWNSAISFYVSLSSDIFSSPCTCSPLYFTESSCRPSSRGSYLTLTVPSRLSSIIGLSMFPLGIFISAAEKSTFRFQFANNYIFLIFNTCDFRHFPTTCTLLKWWTNDLNKCKISLLHNEFWAHLYVNKLFILYSLHQIISSL